MKVRIIKAGGRYVPQVYTHLYGETAWYSLGGVDKDLWSDPSYVYKFCRHYTQWGAMWTLKKYISKTLNKDRKLESFKKDLDKPNVVYEAEV